MIDFLLLILAGVGLTFILSSSSIASAAKYKLKFWEDNGVPKQRFLRDGKPTKLSWFVDKFVDMLNCHQCCGFWAGMIVFGLYYFDVYFLLWGFIISLMSMFGWATYNFISNAVAIQEYQLEEVDDELQEETGDDEESGDDTRP